MQHKGAMAANHAIAAARGSVETRAFATVEVHAAAAPILPAWADLETRAPCSIYQTRAWLMPWIDTLGRKAGLAPLFVLARGADERPVALLCLGIARRGPVRVATWLGGKDANFAMPLAAPGVVWSKAEVTRLLREAARAASANRPDVFLLANQPVRVARARQSVRFAPKPGEALAPRMARRCRQTPKRCLPPNCRRRPARSCARRKRGSQRWAR